MEHSWPRARLGEGLHALARKTDLRRDIPHIEDPPNAPPPEKDSEQLHDWLDSAAAWLGVEAQALSLPHPELYRFLEAPGPAIIRVSDDAFLLVVGATRRGLRVLDEDARVHTLTRKSVGQRNSESERRPCSSDSSEKSCEDRGGSTRCQSAVIPSGPQPSSPRRMISGRSLLIIPPSSRCHRPAVRCPRRAGPGA